MSAQRGGFTLIRIVHTVSDRRGFGCRELPSYSGYIPASEGRVQQQQRTARVAGRQEHCSASYYIREKAAPEASLRRWTRR